MVSVLGFTGIPGGVWRVASYGVSYEGRGYPVSGAAACQHAYPALSLESESATLGRGQQANSNQEQQTAIDRPLGLTRHEAARENVDSLQKPHAAHQTTERAHEV
jgi:hypothetical protein